LLADAVLSAHFADLQAAFLLTQDRRDLFGTVALPFPAPLESSCPLV
jgi:hypothetical protein